MGKHSRKDAKKRKKKRRARSRSRSVSRSRSPRRDRKKARKESEAERRQRKMERKARKVASFAGYTNEDNPFGDSNLHSKFVWRKRVQQKRSEGKDVDLSSRAFLEKRAPEFTGR